MKVVGLGTLCLTSQFLKQLGLKEASMPFDWIFSSPEMIHHAIRDDFKEFLDLGNVEEIPLDRRPHPELHRANHTFYRDHFGVHFIYNHHEPSLNDADHDYFVRCVERFRALLRSSDDVIFLQFRNIFSEPSELSRLAYARLADLLHPHSLLCIEIINRGVASPSYEVIVSDGNLEIGRLNTAVACNGVSFGSQADHEAAAAVVRARMAGEKPEATPMRTLLPGDAAPAKDPTPISATSPRHIDQVTLYRGMLTVDGWAKCGPPVVLYEGQPVSAWKNHPALRPDVVQAYGPAATEWGFTIQALVARPPVDATKIALSFPDGTTIASPNILRITAQGAQG